MGADAGRGSDHDAILPVLDEAIVSGRPNEERSA
jgi:hypothetical protein